MSLKFSKNLFSACKWTVHTRTIIGQVKLNCKGVRLSRNIFLFFVQLFNILVWMFSNNCLLKWSVAISFCKNMILMIDLTKVNETVATISFRSSLKKRRNIASAYHISAPERIVYLTYAKVERLLILPTGPTLHWVADCSDRRWPPNGLWSVSSVNFLPSKNC